MLRDRQGGPFRFSVALGWALTWAVGVATGVALGGWLTLVGGSGAPGAGELQPASDLVGLPALAFGVVAVVHLVGQLVAATVRGRSVPRGE